MEITDELIIEKFFARDEKAIDDMNRKYGDLCRCISYNILKNNSDTEECINSSYLSLWNAIPPTRPKSLKAYLCEVVRNTAFAILKSRNRTGHQQIYFMELAEILPATESPESELDCKTLIRYINKFLASRKELDRKIFVMRYYYNLSVKDIGARLGVKEATVKTKLHRAREELRSFLRSKDYNV